MSDTNPNLPADWPATLARMQSEAQEATHMHLCGIPFERIPYGADHLNSAPTCRDCGVKHGMLHVDRCCIEKCPICSGQAAWCGCADGDVDDDDDDEGETHRV